MKLLSPHIHQVSNLFWSEEIAMLMSAQKALEKLLKYEDLKIEMPSSWGMKIKIAAPDIKKYVAQTISRITTSHTSHARHFQFNSTDQTVHS